MTEKEKEALFDTVYQSGKQALQAFQLDAAFEALTEPALHGYKEGAYLMSLIVRSATRIRRVKEERFERLQQEADAGDAFAQYVTAQYYGVRKQDWDGCFRYSEMSAAQDLSFGICTLANCYKKGLGTLPDQTKYLELIRKAILMHNTTAMHCLALDCLCGLTVKEDVKTGIALLEKGVDLGDPQCINTLADITMRGAFTPANPKKAQQLAEQALSLGYIESYATLASICLCESPTKISNTDRKKGFTYLMKGAGYGEADCMCDLAAYYEQGYFGENNTSRRLEWYWKAVRAGSQEAYYALGYIYYNEEMPNNPDLAWFLFSEGYTMAYEKCAYMLGVMCIEGDAPKKNVTRRGVTECDSPESSAKESVTKESRAPESSAPESSAKESVAKEGDLSEGIGKEAAIHYFEQAALWGNYAGCKSMLELYDIYHQGEIVEPDEAKAMGWLKKAVGKNDPDALLRYGKLLTKDEASDSDKIKGLFYLKQALSKGNYDAAIELGRLYRKESLFLDLEKGRQLYELAAFEKQHPEAYYALGSIVLTEKKEALAKEYFENAAQQGHGMAQYALGELIRTKHKELPVDKEEAWIWYKKAAKSGVVEAQVQLIIKEALLIEKNNTPENRKRLLELVFSPEIAQIPSFPEEKMERYYQLMYLPLTNNTGGDASNDNADGDSRANGSASSANGNTKNTSETTSLSQICKTLFICYNQLHEYFHQSCDARQLPHPLFKGVSAAELTPYASRDVLLKIKEDIVMGWYMLKSFYPAELSEFSLTSDQDKLLDFAESTKDQDLTLGILNIVECCIELTDMYKYQMELYTKMEAALSDHSITRFVTDLFRKGDRGIAPNRFLVAFWRKHDAEKYFQQLSVNTSL